MQELTIITHGIKGMPHHYITNRGLLQLSHCPRKRTVPHKILSKITIGTCRGFKILGKFYSLSYLESKAFPFTRVILPEEINDCPF